MVYRIMWGAKQALVSANVTSFLVFVVQSMFGFGVFRFALCRVGLQILFPYDMIVLLIIELLIRVVILFKQALKTLQTLAKIRITTRTIVELSLHNGSLSRYSSHHIFSSECICTVLLSEAFTDASVPQFFFSWSFILSFWGDEWIDTGFSVIQAPHMINICSRCLVLGYVWQKSDSNTSVTAIFHGMFNSI